MTLDKFTIKAQETVQEAVNTAQRNGQQTIEPIHLLAGLLEKAKDVTTFIFQKLGINAQQIEMLVSNELKHLRRVRQRRAAAVGAALRKLYGKQNTQRCRMHRERCACRHRGAASGTAGEVAVG